MISTSIKLRTYNAAGAHEIVLPNRKVLLIDPYFSGTHMDGHSIDDITGADYILITHTHFDHDIDLGYIAEKFNSKIFVGAFSAFPLLRFHKLPFDNVYPVYPGQALELDDFTLHVIQSKHNPMGLNTYQDDFDITYKEIGIKGHKDCDDCGSIESLNYMITTNNSFRILLVGGRTVSNNFYSWCKEKAPNILLRQAGVRKPGTKIKGKQITAKELAAVFVKYHAQILMPWHMEPIYIPLGKENAEGYFNEVAEEVKRLDPGAIFVLPEAWKWYNIGIGIEIE